MIKQKSFTKRNLAFKIDTTKNLFQKYFNQKYSDKKDQITDVLNYSDEKK